MSAEDRPNKAPAVATVDLATLRRLHGALIGESDAAEIDGLILDLASLIDVARAAGERPR